MFRKRKEEERKAQEKRKKARVRRRALKERNRHRQRKQKDGGKADEPQKLEEWEERKYLLAQQRLEALRLLRVLLRKIAVRLFPSWASVLVGTDLSLRHRSYTEAVADLKWTPWKTHCVDWGLFSIGFSLITPTVGFQKRYPNSLQGHVSLLPSGTHTLFLHFRTILPKAI